MPMTLNTYHQEQIVNQIKSAASILNRLIEKAAENNVIVELDVYQNPIGQEANCRYLSTDFQVVNS